VDFFLTCCLLAFWPSISTLSLSISAPLLSLPFETLRNLRPLSRSKSSTHILRVSRLPFLRQLLPFSSHPQAIPGLYPPLLRTLDRLRMLTSHCHRGSNILISFQIRCFIAFNKGKPRYCTRPTGEYRNRFDKRVRKLTFPLLQFLLLTRILPIWNNCRTLSRTIKGRARQRTKQLQ
jgi:hypothetical protein